MAAAPRTTVACPHDDVTRVAPEIGTRATNLTGIRWSPETGSPERVSGTGLWLAAMAGMRAGFRVSLLTNGVLNREAWSRLLRVRGQFSAESASESSSVQLRGSSSPDRPADSRSAEFRGPNTETVRLSRLRCVGR